MKPDSLAARLLAAFLEDLNEQLGTLDTHLLALEANPSSTESLQAVFRVAHTLKGAAGATGVPYVGEACHLLEERLSSARDGSRPLEPADFQLLFFANDALADVGRRLKNGRTLDDSPIVQLHAILQGKATLPTPDSPSESAPPDATTHDGDSHIRIAAEKVDALMASGSQLLASRSRLSSRTQEIDELHNFVAQWASQWLVRGAQVRRLVANSPVAKLLPLLDGFDNNLNRLVQDTGRITRNAASDADALDGMIGTMFERVRNVRMRPFEEICTALPRMVRDESTALGKEVELVITGKEVEADRGVLEAVREALLHLVRNAIDHGIETVEARQRANKAPRGRIEISAAIVGERLVVTVHDDGDGIDPNAVRQALQARGLPVPSEDEDVLRTLFVGGVSTRSETTTLSGRGVGLDAVEAAANKIGGNVAVTSVSGRGTTFTLECPLTLATIRALLVSVGEQLIAIPTSAITHLQRVPATDIGRAEGRDVYLADPKPIPVASLARLLGPPLLDKRSTGLIALVIVQSREGQLALVVDRLLNEEEIVVQPIARAGDLTPMLSGATILGTGEIAFVVNLASVIRAGLETESGYQPLVTSTTESPARKRVLIVDDSITTRTLEQSTVEAAGYEAVTAVDGTEAWRLLQNQPFDLVVSDIEMPRMDGLALCETIRGNKRTHAIPVILVTALESAAQRMRGLEVGADAYVGKSTFDQQALIDTIRQLIG